MTQDQIDAIKAEIVAVINGGSAVASAVAPEYQPLILLGKAVALQVPSLFEDVVKLIQKTAPTDAEATELAQRIAQLSHPESL